MINQDKWTRVLSNSLGHYKFLVEERMNIFIHILNHKSIHSLLCSILCLFSVCKSIGFIWKESFHFSQDKLNGHRDTQASLHLCSSIQYNGLFFSLFKSRWLLNPPISLVMTLWLLIAETFGLGIESLFSSYISPPPPPAAAIAPSSISSQHPTKHLNTLVNIVMLHSWKIGYKLCPTWYKCTVETQEASDVQCFFLSKEFVDTHSLVTHAFNSSKVGLKTDHLGLHKALCVMMGWNSLMAPDNARAYQSIPAAEATALKEDLILWPPLIVIHNSSIGRKNAGEQVVITNERMEEILREMGFRAGSKVCRGKPANHSILVVKFLPTFSGLQEAERLHKYYVENKRGRKEFQQIASDCISSGKVREAPVGKVEELLLYGYMGIAEDLDKLDFETKKRSLVKSMKEIEAIADASLN